MNADRDAINAAIAAAVARYEDRFAPPVGSAVRYALEGGGKRLRGMLLLSSYRACGGRADASGLAAAVEIVHAYSLVHDDLPCMDDDDLRRGRPTVHRAFDVTTATVAGIAMVPLAACVVLDAAADLGLTTRDGNRLTALLMRASGAGGMIGGQLYDLLGEGRALDLASLERVHRGKTGALIAASSAMGALGAGAPADRVRAFEHFGAALGLAFQITDDVLDVTETSEALGKTAGKDATAAKSTYVSLLGVDAARDRARRLVGDACDEIDALGLLGRELRALANLVFERRT